MSFSFLDLTIFIGIKMKHFRKWSYFHHQACLRWGFFSEGSIRKSWSEYLDTKYKNSVVYISWKNGCSSVFSNGRISLSENKFDHLIIKRGDEFTKTRRQINVTLIWTSINSARSQYQSTMKKRSLDGVWKNWTGH